MNDLFDRIDTMSEYRDGIWFQLGQARPVAVARIRRTMVPNLLLVDTSERSPKTTNEVALEDW